MKKHTLLLCGLVACLPASASKADSDFWTVSLEHSTCLKEILGDLISRSDDPLVIFLDVECGTAPPVPNAEGGGGRETPAIPQQEPGETDEVLVFSHEELLCLQERLDNIIEIQLLLPRKPCSQ